KMMASTPHHKNSFEDLPSVLVLGSGGAKGILELGAMIHSMKRGLHGKIKYIMGVSVGSVIALLMVCGYTINEIIVESCKSNMLDLSSSINFADILPRLG